jgi:DNA polymerase/3'-5' exonuclease PolX
VTTIELPLEKASAIAAKLTELITERGMAGRVEVVGSVRRKKPVCGDVELLVEPTAGIWSDPPTFSVGVEDLGLVPGPNDKLGRRAPNGPRYYRKQFWLDDAETRAFQVDLFVCLPPAQWGIIELIRTGDKDFSQQMVTRLHRVGLRTQGGQLEIVPGEAARRYGWKPPLLVPDEATFFGLVGVTFIPPELRNWSNPETRARVLAP